MTIEIRGVEKLSFRERQVVALKEMGLSTNEITKRLGLSASTVATLLAKPLIYASLLLTLICGASSAVTLLQEYHDTRTWSTRHPIPPHP